MRPSSYIDGNNTKADWRIIFSLLPYLFEFKVRVVLAFAFLVSAKLAGVAMPWVLKLIVDDLDLSKAEQITVPVMLLLGYGLLRFGTVFLGELRDAVFARVTERAMRRVGLKVFQHLHRLDLDFHLSRKTGGLSRDIERGVSGISFLLRFLLFNILPTLLEIALIAFILLGQFSISFALGIVISVLAYVGFSVVVTEWRNKFVREVNEKDSRSNSRAIDSLLNYETVKYFNNESYEAKEYDKNLESWEKSRLKNRLTLTALNSGQALIIAVSMTAMMLMCAQGVASGALTLGDFVMVNAYMIQLFVPLNFLGFVYREIRQALINIERMFSLMDKTPKIIESENPQPLVLDQSGQVAIEFNDVSFSYDNQRQILDRVSFNVLAGQKVAIVGASGAGKSTVAKLLFRFYDVSSGEIKFNGVNIKNLGLDSLRASIGVVPQDTVLFNDTIHYNIDYGKPGSDQLTLEEVAQKAHLSGFLKSLPEGLNTLVGERGLKISGGEKQRISIARVLLKNPPVLIFDEATSALDTEAEKTITQALDEMAVKHTTVVIAHRLSTIMNADNIVVLDQGRVVEQGTHKALLAQGGRYSDLWSNQVKEQQELLN